MVRKYGLRNIVVKGITPQLTIIDSNRPNFYMPSPNEHILTSKENSHYDFQSCKISKEQRAMTRKYGLPKYYRQRHTP